MGLGGMRGRIDLVSGSREHDRGLVGIGGDNGRAVDEGAVRAACSEARGHYPPRFWRRARALVVDLYCVASSRCWSHWNGGPNRDARCANE